MVYAGSAYGAAPYAGAASGGTLRTAAVRAEALVEGERVRAAAVRAEAMSVGEKNAVAAMRAEVLVGPPAVSASLTGSGTFAATATVVEQYSAEVLADSPSLYWRFSETSGTAVADSSGNARAGTIDNANHTRNAPSLLTTSSDPAMTLTGGNSIVSDEAGVAWINIPAFTAEVVFKANSFAGQPLIMAQDNDGVSTAIRWRVYVDPATGKLQCVMVNTANAYVTYDTGIVLSTGTTYYVALTYASGTMTFYVNGVAATPYSVDLKASGQAPLRLGGARSFHTSGTYSGTYNGTLDEFAYYPTALSAARIAAHHAAGTGTAAVPAVSAALTGSGNFTASVVHVAVRSAALAGSGDFTAFAVHVAVRSANVTGSGNFAAVVDGTARVTALFTGTGTFTATTSTSYSLTVTAPFTGAGTFTATTSYSLKVTAPFTGAGTFTATSSYSLKVTASFPGSGTFAAVVDGSAKVTATFVGSGTFAATLPVPATFTGSGTFTADAAINLAPAYLLVLAGTVEQPPGTISVAVANVEPLTLVTFAINGTVVGSETSDNQGEIAELTLPVTREFTAGTHTVTGSTTGSVASGTFTVLRSADPLPEVEQPDAPPVFVPAAVYKWVLQDLMPGGIGSWVMPINPTTMGNPHVRKTVAATATTAVRGRPHVSQGATPVEWEFAGFCPDQAFQDKLIAYSELPYRFYLIDHRQRAWVVAFVGLSITPRKRIVDELGVFRDDLADYQVRVALFSQTPTVVTA